MPAQSDQTWQRLALLRWTQLIGMRIRCTGKEEVVAFLDLLKRIGIVIPNLDQFHCLGIRDAH